MKRYGAGSSGSQYIEQQPGGQPSESVSSPEIGHFSEFPDFQESSVSTPSSTVESLPPAFHIGLEDYPSSATVSSATPVPSVGGPDSPEEKKTKRKTFILRSVLAALAALSAIAIVGLRLHGKKFPAGVYLWDGNLALLDEVNQKFVVDPSPDCFIKHESFTADTPDAQAAQRSLKEWLNKATTWAEALKKPGGETQQPEKWEMIILRGALVCRNIPHLEAEAALSPYSPCAHGFSRESALCAYDTAESPENVQRENEECARVKQAKAELRSKRLGIVSWICEMRERLAELAEQYSELNKGTGGDTLYMDEILSAQQFYKLLGAHAESFAVPSDDAPLKVLDGFVSQRSASAAKAASALPTGNVNDRASLEDTSDTAATEDSRAAPQPNAGLPSFGIDLCSIPAAVRAEMGNNRFIPAWVAQVFLAPKNMELSPTVRLRLAVESSGIPFAPKHETCFSEFKTLVQDTIEYEKEYEDLQSLPLDSPERKEKQRRLHLIQMHSEVALAAFRIPSLEKRITAIRARDSESPHDLRRLTRTLTMAYDQLGNVAHKWAAPW